MKVDAKSIDTVCERPDEAEVRQRACLMCAEPFESAWAGERICTKCKSRSGWRGGRN